MAQPKDIQRFTEIEYCIYRYFNCHIVPVMKHEKEVMQKARTKEIADYRRSLAGIMRSIGNAMYNEPDDTLLYLRTVGEECSKTSEDYVLACNEKISGNADIQKDMQQIADGWRTAVIKEIGKERYDELCIKLGGDLAFAYIDKRIQQLMINRMVSDKMPKSSFEYIIRKGVSGSLFGMAYEVNKSQLDTEIEECGETIYNPSKAEKVAAKGLSIVSDAAATGCVYSWASLAGAACGEVVFSGLESVFGKEQPSGVSVDEVISQAVFGGNTNQFEAFRKKGMEIKEYENTYLHDLNSGLSKKMNLIKDKPFWEIDFSTPPSEKYGIWGNVTAPCPKEKERDVSIPLVIAPGYEQQYLEDHKTHTQNNIVEEQSEQKTRPVTDSKTVANQDIAEECEKNSMQKQQGLIQDDNQPGWSGLLQSFGFDGFSDIGRNLPYIIAMLPDMLVGLLTGKTKSVALKNDMLPVASILMGMVVGNPLLKMILIGMGGANLLNKIGHEAIDRENISTIPAHRYRYYKDEDLDPRIVSPVLRGNVMVATIDGVPCSVTIPDAAANAFREGALPLNTLANAILARHDSMRGTGQDNTCNINMDTAISRDRGMTIR